MKTTIDAFLGRHLAAWVARVQGKPRVALLSIALLTLCFALLAVFRLGINSDNLDLISPKLPSRIDHARFSESFPNSENALIIVIDGESGQSTRKAVNTLTARLNQLPDTIESAYSSNGGEFFEQHGLLYSELNGVEEFSHKVSQLRPFILPLEREPNLVTLSNLTMKNMRASRASFDYEAQWVPLITQMTQATNAATLTATSASTTAASNAPVTSNFTELKVFESLQTSLLSTEMAADKNPRRHVIVAHPVLEFGNILAANRSIKAVRSAASELGIDANNGFSVRVTGNPALNLEEMIGIAWDIGVAGIFCFALVVVVLIFALRSLPLVVATIATLLVGLVWTAGFAALAVGHLNIVSLSVAILFIGLGVDFAIHLGMRYADALRSGLDEFAAMQLAVSDVGSSLLICTVSTAIAFLVFVPTPYLGVAELGLIAGAGMVIIMFLTVTLFPALLVTYLKINTEKHLKRELRFDANLGVWVQRHSRRVLSIAALALIAGLFVAPKAYFDPNVIDMRDPSTESVQTFNDLLNESGLASPWYLNAVAPNLESAKHLAQRANELETVDQAITIADFVPDEQGEKLEILSDTFKLFKRREQSSKNELPTTEKQLEALFELQKFIKDEVVNARDEKFIEEGNRLIQSLSGLLKLSNNTHDKGLKISKALSELQGNMIGGLPEQLVQLRKALSPRRINVASLPSEIQTRMVASDGQARVQIFPSENLRNEDNLRAFVSSVQTLAPHASGIAVNIIAFEEATKVSFKQALGSALLLITLLLIYLWRNVLDVVLVLAPLFLSLVLAIASMALLNLPFNFVNVIVIPLMFGIGVDSGIHLVHRSHSGHLHKNNLLNTTTARAVYFSALTTLISFGSLSFSAHKGMSSLGVLLAIGMVLTVVCNLVVLPALLEQVRGQKV